MASNLPAIELLKMGNEGRQPPALNKIWPYVMGVICGAGSACFVNMGSMRPILSGIQKHVIYSAIGCTVLHFVEEKRQAYYAEKDAILRHYVSLHPEDFPIPERRKIGDLVEKWIPVR